MSSLSLLAGRTVCVSNFALLVLKHEQGWLFEKKNLGPSHTITHYSHITTILNTLDLLLLMPLCFDLCYEIHFCFVLSKRPQMDLNFPIYTDNPHHVPNLLLMRVGRNHIIFLKNHFDSSKQIIYDI